MKRLLAALLVAGLIGCASAPKQSPSVASALPGRDIASAQPLPERCAGSPYAPAQEDPGTRGDYVAGGLYKPGVPDTTPSHVPDVECIPEPQVVNLPRSRVGNRATYAVLGKQYRVLDDQSGYVEQGLASYYGNKFHGRRTSNLEVYDMYAFSAAHKSLPLPSFARVSNLDNGKSVIVRVNDRGPFHEGRVIDLSYAAAVKLDIVQRGTGRVEVRALVADEAMPVYASIAPAPKEVATGVSTADPGLASAALASATMITPTAMDALVATIPAAAATGAAVGGMAIDPVPSLLPPGVRIATGKPTRLSGDGSPAPQRAAVTGTPEGAQAPPPNAASGPVDALPALHDYRFDMRQNGKPMNADEFEGWMRARKVQVATGKAVQLAVPSGQAPVPEAAARSSEKPRAIKAIAADADAITLQVASFAARGNADRALAMLQGAGIGQARLLDANANGKQVWRLRVGPLAASVAPELATRIVGLGFGTPQRVRD